MIRFTYQQLDTVTTSAEKVSDKMICFFLMVCVAASSVRETSAFQEFSTGNHKFTTDIYKELIKTNKNLVASPLSAEIVLALTSEGAKGVTKQELTHALYLPIDKSTETAVNGLRLNISSKDVKLLSANKIYIGKFFQIEPSFEDLAKNVYKAGIENIDFGNNINAANSINHWVADNTNNRITNLIDANQISSGTRIVLVNALYFSGKWSNPFSSRNTRSETFYITSNATKQVDMMHSGNSGTRCRFLHSVQLKAKFLEMSYKNSNTTMTVILPDARDGLSQIEKNLETYLEQRNLNEEIVDIALPKFKITSSIDFKDILMKLGVQKLFENSADLSGIAKGEKLLVDHIVQKAFIDVSESGTEAAAATAVIGGLTAVLEPSRPELTFIADHPFLYYLRDTESRVVLFAGRFIN